VNQNISNILGGLTLGTDYDQVSRFNTQTGSYAHYNGIDKFNQFTTLEFGKGYQIYVTNHNGVDITLSNLTHPDKLLALRQGWNLLGAPSETSIPFTEAFNNLTWGSDYDYVTGWNTELNAYEYPSSLDPAKSYWLYAYQDNSWQIHSNTNAYATYTYNGDGERIAKYTPKNEIHYYHDGSNTLYETNAGNNITTSYTHTLSIDDLISERKLGETQFRLNDHLGSLRKTANQSQSITGSVTYDAFGKPSSTTSSRFLFTGRELDPETNLYYYRARTYQPSLGRFMSKDPAGFLDSMNIYFYVANDPVSLEDPLGLFYFGKRNLDGLEFMVNNPVDDFFNTELSHEQGFFEDVPRKGQSRDIGFGPDGRFSGEDPSKYIKSGKHYDDNLIRQALKKVNDGNYCAIGNNCQNWSERLRREYDRVKQQKKARDQRIRDERQKKEQERKKKAKG